MLLLPKKSSLFSCYPFIKFSFCFVWPYILCCCVLYIFVSTDLFLVYPSVKSVTHALLRFKLIYCMCFYWNNQEVLYVLYVCYLFRGSINISRHYILLNSLRWLIMLTFFRRFNLYIYIYIYTVSGRETVHFSYLVMITKLHISSVVSPWVVYEKDFTQIMLKGMK